MADQRSPSSNPQHQPPPPPPAGSPLHYAAGGTRPPGRGGAGKQILTGFLVGCAISGIAYPALWGKTGDAAGWAMTILLVAKVIVGLVFLLWPGKRGYGGGLLASIAVGAIVFFLTCAANFSP